MSDEQRRGPECIDPPERTYQTFFAEWTWSPMNGDVYSVSFKLWKAVAWEPNGDPLFQNNEDAMDFKPIDKCEPLMHGFRKWDGCTQWWWPEQMHEDDADDTELFFRMVRKCHLVCAQIIGDKWLEGEPK